jgi:hypothetical protein
MDLAIRVRWLLTSKRFIVDGVKRRKETRSDERPRKMSHDGSGLWPHKRAYSTEYAGYAGRGLLDSFTGHE